MGMIIMNGKEYTSSPKDGFPPIIYSDEEREIGVWRDGKPLYQKTINIQNPSHDSNWHDIPHGISNSDIFANINGIAYWVVNANTIAHVPIPSRDEVNSANYGILIRIVGSNLQYAITGYGSTTFSKMSVTLQYTKTTDTPGSGKYTTYGGLAHHYSTTEQVIGTWIDGKPIYEKVIPVTTTAQSYSLDVSALNIDYVVFIKVRIKNANNLSHSYCDSPYWYSNTDWFRYYFPENNNVIIFESGSAFSYGSGYVILQYTKTTD